MRHIIWLLPAAVLSLASSVDASDLRNVDDGPNGYTCWYTMVRDEETRERQWKLVRGDNVDEANSKFYAWFAGSQAHKQGWRLPGPAMCTEPNHVNRRNQP